MLKHRLAIGIVLAMLVSGCAAGRAYRQGQEASARRRLGFRRDALHEGGPGESREGGIQDRARASDAEARRASTQPRARARGNTISSMRRCSNTSGRSNWIRRTVWRHRSASSSKRRSAIASKRSRPKPPIEGLRERGPPARARRCSARPRRCRSSASARTPASATS